MPPRTSAAYADCEKVFLQALASENGLRVEFDEVRQAMAFRHRLNSFRSLIRKESRKTYADIPDHPQYDRSPYDEFTIRVDTEKPAALIEKEREITGKISAL